MNLLKRSLTLLVVMAFTSQALTPELAQASATAPVVDQAEDMEDTEEEEEEAPAQSSKLSFFDLNYIVPAVVVASVLAATIWHFRKNFGAAFPFFAAGGFHRGNPQQMAGHGADDNRGCNAIQANTALAAAVEARVATPSQTPMRQRGVVAQADVVAEAPVHTATHVGKKVAFADGQDDVHTPVLPPASSKKARTDTPIPARQVGAPAQRSPVVAVLAFAIDAQTAQAANEFDDEEEKDFAPARKSKKQGAATAVKRTRKTAHERLLEEAAAFTAVADRIAARVTKQGEHGVRKMQHLEEEEEQE